MQPPADKVAFIRDNTTIAMPPLVPEVKLHLATEITPIWQATERLLRDAQLPPPFWAFAWPGGQALARYILDSPEHVRGRRILDLGAGSGLEAIAAARAGAAHVLAVDMDDFACAAVELNAALNGVTVETRCGDVTAGTLTDVDVILAGDVCYERAAADRIVAWLRGCAAQGILVLLADPGRTYLPKTGIELLTRYDIATSLELEDRTTRDTGIWRLLAA